jgi:hypothetical protein
MTMTNIQYLTQNLNEKALLSMELLDMVRNGMEPIDCLYTATSAGYEYPDAVWFVSRVLKLSKTAVAELEAAYN